MKIVQDYEDEINQNIVKINIQHINIFRHRKDMADQLYPVTNSIDCCLADNDLLASTCDKWLSLLNHSKLQSLVFKSKPSSSNASSKKFSLSLQVTSRIPRSQAISCSNRWNEWISGVKKHSLHCWTGHIPGQISTITSHFLQRMHSAFTLLVAGGQRSQVQWSMILGIFVVYLL